MTFTTIVFVVVPVSIILFLLLFLSSRYRRCAANQVLVISGRVGGTATHKCLHGGGTVVLPLIQESAYLSLEPIQLTIDLKGALSAKNIRVNVPSTFTIAISPEPEIVNNAAIRILGLNEENIQKQAEDIIIGQLRQVIATMTIEQINTDRDTFKASIYKNVESELNKVGLTVINVNITDISDESGYIEAIGKKAAAEAIEKANIDVAQQKRDGEIGVETANKERDIIVAQQKTESEIGVETANKEKQVNIAKQLSEAEIGVEVANKERDIQVARQKSDAEIGKKDAEKDKRVQTQSLESEAISGENTAKANIADSNANLAEKEAEAKRRGQVAFANAQTAILEAERLQRTAALRKDELAQEEVDKEKKVVSAEAEAERIRRVAQGDADAVKAKYFAEAEGTKAVLEAKAAGYQSLVNSTGGSTKDLAALLMVEKIETIVEKQTEAISNLDFGKIVVWDGGNGDKSGLANFVQSVGKVLPPLHELVGMAGVELPSYLGSLKEDSDKIPPTPPEA